MVLQMKLKKYIAVGIKFVFEKIRVSHYIQHDFICQRYQAGIYLLKVNNRNTGTSCEICLKFTIKTPERHQWCRSGVFIVDFEHNSHLVLVFLLLTLNMYCRLGRAH